MSDAAWRDVHRGRVWRAQACRIVEESADWIALWMPPGSPGMLPVDERGRRIRIPGDTWELEPATASNDALCVARPGRRHSIYPHWREGVFAYWYVNFERPLRRSAVGFDTFDEKLDLIVQPDGSYRWKDEDELDWPPLLGCSTPTPCAPRRSASSRSGPSRRAGRTGGPIPPGRSRSYRRAGIASDQPCPRDSPWDTSE